MKNTNKIIWSAVMLAGLGTPLPASAENQSTTPLKNTVLTSAVQQAQTRPKSNIITRQMMLKRQYIRETHLSPDGSKLAFRTLDKGLSQLYLYDTVNQQTKLLVTSRDMKAVHWTTDSQFLLIENSNGLATLNIQEDQPFPNQILNLDKDQNEKFVAIAPNKPHHFFLRSIAPKSFDYTLYRISIDGTREQLYQGKHALNNFLTTSTGALKYTQIRDGKITRIEDVSGAEPSVVFTCTLEELCQLVSHMENGDIFLTGHKNNNYAALQKFTRADGRFKTLHKDPAQKFDISWVYVNAKDGTPYLAKYETDTVDMVGLTDEIRQHVRRIKGQIQSPVITIQPDTHGKKWLVNDGNPVKGQQTQYLYDLKDKTLTRPLAKFWQDHADKRTEIDPGQLSVRTAFWYKATDGFDLQGYLTLPNGTELKTAPMVVVPHGGPWNRTTGRFSATAQFLASRGYIVFEPNFRSSVGLGADYIKAANRDFGKGRVQQDILDGADYLLAHGIGDRSRMAIAGHSFGGFSALGALAFTPDLFKVGIAGAPPASLTKAITFTAKAEQSPQARHNIFTLMKERAVDVYDPKDIKRLADQSPDAHAANIKHPLYIWAGEKDPKVNILDVREYVLKLEALGKKVAFMSAPSAPHSPKKTIAKEAYFYMMEHALHAHIGGGIEADMSSRLRRYLNKHVVMGDMGQSNTGR